MNETELLTLFGSVAAQAIKYFTEHRECITACRFVKEVFEHFGVWAIPSPVSFAFKCASKNAMYMAGFPEYQEQLKDNPNVTKLPTITGKGWEGHLALRTPNFWIDPTFGQASMPQHDLAIPPDQMLVIPLENAAPPPDDMGLELGLVMDNGLEVTATYHPLNDWDFLDTEAWQLDHIQKLIDGCIAQMKFELLGADRKHSAKVM